MTEEPSESRSPRTPPADVVAEATALLGDSPKSKTLRSRIAELKKEQTEAIAKKKQIAKDLRNHQRRNKRLRERVVGLTDEDMVDVIRMRAEKNSRPRKLWRLLQRRALRQGPAALVPLRHLACAAGGRLRA